MQKPGLRNGNHATQTAFDAEVNAIGVEQQGRLTFTYVGPLPPYSFVKIVVRKAKEEG